MSDVRLSRRNLLLAGGAAVTAASLAAGLAGCEAVVNDATARPAPIEPLTPVLRGQQQLLGSYAQTLSAYPELSPTLSDLAVQSAAHTDALREAAPAAAAQVAASGSSSDPAGSTGQSPAPPGPTLAPDAATALSDLAHAVDAAAGALGAAALRAKGELAALLGSCAASTACHARLLGL